MPPRSSIKKTNTKHLGELGVSDFFRTSHHFLKPPSRITLTLHVTSVDAVPRNPESTARSGALEPELGAGRPPAAAGTSPCAASPPIPGEPVRLISFSGQLDHGSFGSHRPAPPHPPLQGSGNFFWCLMSVSACVRCSRGSPRGCLRARITAGKGISPGFPVSSGAGSGFGGGWDLGVFSKLDSWGFLREKPDSHSWMGGNWATGVRGDLICFTAKAWGHLFGERRAAAGERQPRQRCPGWSERPPGFLRWWMRKRQPLGRKEMLWSKR